MGITRWQSLSFTLAEMTKQGVNFRLSPDTLEMQFSAADGVLSEWEREYLHEYRKQFTEALRHERGLCITCGMEQSKRPSPHGRRKEFIEDTLKVRWVPAVVPDHLMKHYEPLFCDACWDTGAMEMWSGITTQRTTNAKSNYQRGRSRAQEIAFPPDDGERTPSENAEADLFAGF